MYDVLAIGESLIDLTPCGMSEQGHPLYEANPGGAPTNVLAALSKLGKKTAFIGKVGQDAFGRQLEAAMKASGIDRTGLVFDSRTPTTLACVHLDGQGDRSFSFYRNPGADLELQPGEVDTGLIDRASMFHFGSVSLSGEPSRTATFQAVMHAKRKNKLISYDPNLRESLWSDLDEARRMILQGMPYADIVKISGEELTFVTGEPDMDLAIGQLYNRYCIPLIFVTLGEQGCVFNLRGERGCLPVYPVEAVDTTGAGDAFMAAVLYQVLEYSGTLDAITLADMEQFVHFACAAGALAATKRGGIPAMPALADIQRLCGTRHINKGNL
ncbi:carbohydrate kinase [Paenibacillus filicis]|uniref:Carbohydrate kinase n=1 Tax=Paenibacillus filicis TaxID=669464 RepID=A0ABU9DGC7_9BACL